MSKRGLVGLSALWIAHAACTGEPVAPQDYAPQGAHGPKIVWDPSARPFPEIPLPNDYATSYDGTSPTGLRVNASLVAPTFFERNLRVAFDRMDGWGTSMPISIPLEGDIDLEDLRRRHPNDPSDFTDDAIYLIDLESGVPVPLDVGAGNYPLSRRDPREPLALDPRASGDNILIATVDEDLNGNGRLEREEDTNFDGVLQRRGARDFSGQTAGHWEPETHTLIVRPLIPLRERRTYAVVVTSRLRASSGPVRSPFDTIGHPQQLQRLRAVEGHLNDASLQRRFYGGLQWGRGEPSQRVAFAWTYTTQTTTTDLIDAQRGVHGQGPLAALQGVAPNFRLARAANLDSPDCTLAPTPYVVPREQLIALSRELIPTLGFDGAVARALIESFEWLEYAAVATIDSPSPWRELVPNDPSSVQWDLDAVRAGQTPRSEKVQLWIFVPRARTGAQAPFPVALYPHGYGVGNYQSIAFAGYFARQGLATVTANAPDHGFALSQGQLIAARAIFRGLCLGPFADSALAGRAIDVNGDGTLDSGAQFLTANIFRTRDMVRQTALDYFQLVRTLREPSWMAPGSVDYNRDGRNDAPGDFNGDGVVDIAGTGRDGQPVPISIWGESLGGLTAQVVGAVEPGLSAVTAVSGGGGFTDITSRSMIGAVQGAVLLPMMGPVILGVPAGERPARNSRTYTSCTGTQTSLRFVLPDANDIGELEFACRNDLQPGDDVMVLNLSTHQRRCARNSADGHLFLPVPADRTDPLIVTIYRGQALLEYEHCQVQMGAIVRNEISNYLVYENDCDVTCGHVPPNAREGSVARTNALTRRAQLTPLFSPAAGLGLRRQTSAVRRFIQLAQAGIDPGDPINYAPLYSLRPWDQRRRPILTMTTAGDDIVPVSVGVTFGRAAGLVPFMTRRTESELDEYFMPERIARTYGGRSAQTLLVDTFVVEGINTLGRHPVMRGPNLLYDIDDLDEGSQLFGEAAATQPLRMVRVIQSDRGVESDPEFRWSPRAGDTVSANLTAYIQTDGAHVFLPSDPAQAWDVGLYLTTLVARYSATAGRDIVYQSDPRNHHCMARGDCPWLPTTPSP
ncbi:MAG: hypothetical protein Q8Q09_12165 [Deltaproteobacteria bacterium]|nr:hypothetical protein [Deltaproteobacteria bacterium]